MGCRPNYYRDLSMKSHFLSLIADGQYDCITPFSDWLEENGEREKAELWRGFMQGQYTLVITQIDLTLTETFTDEDWDVSVDIDVLVEAYEPLVPAPKEGEATMDRKQVWVAQAIACNYGHTWGSTMLPVRDSYAASQIEHLSRRVLTAYDTMPGILYPSPVVDEKSTYDGWIVHETGSGRVTWGVAPEGDEVHIAINRPKGRVLEVIVRRDGTWSVKRTSRDVLLFRRHIESVSLAIVCEALGVTTVRMEITDALYELRHCPDPVNWSSYGVSEPEPAVGPAIGRADDVDYRSVYRVKDEMGGSVDIRDEDTAGHVFLIVEEEGVSAQAALLLHRRRTA